MKATGSGMELMELLIDLVRLAFVYFLGLFTGIFFTLRGMRR